MLVPSAYKAGYEKARTLDPDLACRYVAHTMVGDPDADAVVAAFAEVGAGEASRLIQAAMDRNESTLRDAPQALLDLLCRLEAPPEWADTAEFLPGIRMFHRNSQLVLAAFVGAVLVEGFSTNICKSFFLTGRLHEQGIRRLKQNNRHMLEIFLPGGLDRDGDGWKLTVRIRLAHAQVRRLLAASDAWDTEAWGVPLSSAHMGLAITAFSARLVKHMRRLGAVFNDDEKAGFIAVWRYSGHLMGIPETLLFRDEAEALRLFEIGRLCEPEPEEESIVMANALINSAPLVIGVTEKEARRSMAKYVYGVSRALIGNALADQLRYPKRSSFGVLPWFKLQRRYEYALGQMFPKIRQRQKLDRFTSLLEASMYDGGGISYFLPDHVNTEESSWW